MKHIMKCPKCKRYTMADNCPKCKTKTINPKPAKYSPEDRYAEYRRKAKERILKNKKEDKDELENK